MFSILAIYNNETLLNSVHYFSKVGSKFCSKLIKAIQKFPKSYKILTKWRNFAKSGHTEFEREREKENFADHFCGNCSRFAQVGSRKHFIH